MVSWGGEGGQFAYALHCAQESAGLSVVVAESVWLEDVLTGLKDQPTWAFRDDPFVVVPDVQPHDVLPAQGQMSNLLKLFLIVVYLCRIFNDVDWTLSLFLPPTPLLLVLSSMLSFVV